jgi:hypothetical protein
VKGLLTESDVGLSRVPKPGRSKGELVKPDQLVLDLETREVVVASNKCRDFAEKVDDGAQAELGLIERQVQTDVRELLKKYAGRLYVRRRNHPLYGREITVREVVMIYEAKLVPADVRRKIVSWGKTAARKGDPDVAFWITFQ